MTHDLKILPRYFDAVEDGSKPFEVRRNDRDYQVGDILLLREGNNAEDVIDPPRNPCLDSAGEQCPGCIFGYKMMACPDYNAFVIASDTYNEEIVGHWIYTGRELRRTVTYVLPGGAFGIAKDYCVLGIAPADKAERTCHLIGPPDAPNHKRCSECESEFGLYQIFSLADESSYGKFADAKFCPCCGARIVGP